MRVVSSAIWKDFLTIISQEVGSRVVDTWFRAVTLRQWDSINNVAYLEVPNSFVKDWIKTHYVSLIQFHLGRLLQVHQVRVIFLDARQKNESERTNVPGQQSEPLVTAVQEKPVVHVQPAKLLTPGGKNYSFDSFIVGSGNSMAYGAACAIAEKPGLMYNPLYICGGHGMGKTHLLSAIGNELKKNNGKNVVLFQPADRFVHEFVHAARADKIAQFYSKFHSIDVLLFDDVQCIGNKEQTQEAFFQIFDLLCESRRQIVCTCDSLPQHIKGISERLRSRFSSGLIADLEVPDLSTKIAIVKKKAEQSCECIDDNVAECIASCSNANIRELEGLLVRVLAFASLTKQKISVSLAQHILGRVQLAQTSYASRVDLDTVMRAVCQRYPYSIPEIKSKNRNKDLTFVRHIAMYAMKKYTDKSLRDIGRFLGGRDHTTIVHGIAKIEDQIKCDHELMHVMNTLELELKD